MNNIRKSTNGDLSQRDSSTNPDFVNRVYNALLEREIEAEGIKLAKLKAGKPLGESYIGISEAETLLGQRIARATFQPENDSNYRQQVAVNEHLKEQARQLREDAKRNAQYARDLKSALQSY